MSLNAIEFKETPFYTEVLFDGQHVGIIKQERIKTILAVIGFRYWPKGSNTPGDLFPTLEACKQSLFVPEN